MLIWLKNQGKVRYRTFQLRRTLLLACPDGERALVALEALQGWFDDVYAVDSGGAALSEAEAPEDEAAAGAAAAEGDDRWTAWQRDQYRRRLVAERSRLDSSGTERPNQNREKTRLDEEQQQQQRRQAKVALNFCQ